ncbi:hypothetical protein [Arthrobacter sp. NicSoilC5]|uniref:hypothetical protein n=1 Tax=Arthrobacter sp. NicSoilC5 TaxID=2831000 RepID=UPI001CC386FA|nr:hypothetical protein [Arthrobacter sp. NicSoilC5]BCW78885.1 hypothetical protein NicSoilC5_09040 [Arthrobacter sp. NicSoilC5]
MCAAPHLGRHEAEKSPEAERQKRVDPDERAIQIAAAQLRLVTDRRLGKQTPEWVKQLAAEKPHPRAS